MSATLLLALACSDYAVYEPPVAPPAEPPGRADDDFGQPPDWSDCGGGYLGQYFNHPEGFAAAVEAAGDPGALDWWGAGALRWQSYDAGLDFGGGWWPVERICALEGCEVAPDALPKRRAD